MANTKPLSKKAVKIQNTLAYIKSLKRKMSSKLDVLKTDAVYLDKQEQLYTKALDLEINPGKDGVKVDATSDGVDSFSLDGKELIDLDNDNDNDNDAGNKPEENGGVGDDSTSGGGNQPEEDQFKKEFARVNTYLTNLKAKHDKFLASKAKK